MKKVIDGLMYNTETAHCVGSWDNGRYGNDFYACEETLYKTKKGNYFIYGIGGAASRYARSCGQNTTCGSSDIIPLSSGEAQRWAEEHLSGDGVEKEFAATIEEA
jgi:hypothetical protein